MYGYGRGTCGYGGCCGGYGYGGCGGYGYGYGYGYPRTFGYGLLSRGFGCGFGGCW